MKYLRLVSVALVTLMVMASPAVAHTGGHILGFGSGLLHPVSGFDHMIAFLAVGVWSSLCFLNRGNGQPLTGPAVFLSFLMTGFLLGTMGLALAFLEPAIMASVLLLGVMIMLARMRGASYGLVAIAAFALLHGQAHGLEVAGGVGSYMAGFMVTSLVLLAAGYVFGHIAARFKYGVPVAGGIFIIAGTALIGA